VTEGKKIRERVNDGVKEKAKKRKYLLEDNVLWWIFVILAVLVSLIYYLVVYCLFCDNSESEAIRKRKLQEWERS
jgi:hypothetical protein